MFLWFIFEIKYDVCDKYVLNYPWFRQGMALCRFGKVQCPLITPCLKFKPY
jgi:hypothetical protein